MIPVTKSFIPSIESYQVYLEQIWREGQFTNNGPLVNQLSSELSNFLGISNLELVTNGTIALQLAIKALNLQGEIITTPYSYVATTNSILWEGCKPVFVDIDEQSFCINPHLLEAAITQNTSAILATHVYGYPCDVIKIQQIADKHNLKVIYDAAHAFGVNVFGKSILNYGDCATLSFHATKLFHTGEGGAVCSNNIEVNKKISLLKKFGHMGEDNYYDIGINAKMSELHAAMGLSVLPEVNDIISKRKKCSGWYDEHLFECELLRPQFCNNLEYNYAYYPVVFSSHEMMMTVRQKLFENGVGPRRYFYPSLNTLPYLSRESQQNCPVSESIASRVLCLPLYVGLSETEIAFISMIVKSCF